MEAILPTEIATPIPRDGLLTTATNNSEIAHDLDTVDESRELVKIRMASYQQKMSNSYNKNVYIRTFAVRDLVEEGVSKYDGHERWKLCYYMGTPILN